jgi:hypothetical protein
VSRLAQGLQSVAPGSEYRERRLWHRRGGARLAAEGLEPSSKGARITFNGGTTKVVDGPFAETKEVVGSRWILQRRSLDECIEWVKRVRSSSKRRQSGWYQRSFRVSLSDARSS